jgi:hypothetical protein
MNRPNPISELRDNLKQFKENINIYIKEIIIENEAYIIDMNAEIQLFEQGVNSLGVSIMDYMPYSPITIEIKKEKGQPFNRVTLRDEGDFESSFLIDARNDEFEIKASDWKTQMLKKDYGDEIMGLTDENKGEVIWSYIYPEIRNILINKINGNQ